jgi:hypothetical protein
MKKTKESKTEIPPYEPDIIEKDLCTLFQQEWLKQAAKETGLIKRERKVTAVEMFWVLVNSYGVRLARNLAFIKRNYEKSSNKKLSDSSWYERFTPELVAFLKLCVIHAIEQLAMEQTKVLNEKLAKFKDVRLCEKSKIISFA